MKQIIHNALFFLLLSPPLIAQSLYPTQTVQDSARFRIVARDGKPALEWLNGDTPFPGFKIDALQVDKITLEDADLVLWYHISSSKLPGGTGFSAKILAQDGQELGIIPGVALSATDKQQQAEFPDILETSLVLGQTFTLFVSFYRYDFISCAERPKFLIKKQLPVYGSIALAGLLSVAFGQASKRQQNTYYEEVYRRNWALGSTDLSAANSDWEQVQAYRKRAEILTYAGWGLLAADAVFVTLKWHKIRREQADYDKYCAPKTKISSIEPIFQYTPTLFAAPTPGLKMTISF